MEWMGTDKIQLLPASQFSLGELTEIYNQSRADYMIPMAMDAGELAAYIHLYDVDLAQSVVALEGEQVLGLAMLGVRGERVWITRLGVLPTARRRGMGEVLVQALMENARGLGCRRAVLEVIEGNRAAQSLFEKAGFAVTRGLLILHRAARVAPGGSGGTAAWLDREEALQRIRGCAGQPWTNEVESYHNAEDVLGVEVTGSSRGWVVFQREGARLSHFTLRTAAGDAREVCLALGGEIYRRFKDAETLCENVPAGDPHLGALAELGFGERFRRREMVLGLG